MYSSLLGIVHTGCGACATVSEWLKDDSSDEKSWKPPIHIYVLQILDAYFFPISITVKYVRHLP